MTKTGLYQQSVYVNKKLWQIHKFLLSYSFHSINSYRGNIGTDIIKQVEPISRQRPKWQSTAWDGAQDMLLGCQDVIYHRSKTLMYGAVLKLRLVCLHVYTIVLASQCVISLRSQYRFAFWSSILCLFGNVWNNEKTDCMNAYSKVC